MKSLFTSIFGLTPKVTIDAPASPVAADVVLDHAEDDSFEFNEEERFHLGHPSFDEKVAIEVFNGSTKVQLLYPTRTRRMRIEPSVEVYVLLYKDLGQAIRYVELHGDVRKEFGSKIPMWTVRINGQRDDDVMRDAMDDAKAILHALRNPVIAPDLKSSPPPVVLAKDGPVKLDPTEQAPLLAREGRFTFAGELPWRSPEGKLGKPSFAVIMASLKDGHEERVWGSDLARVIREQKVTPGDVVRLTKYPKTAVVVGNRVVQKNIWTCEVLEQANHAYS